MSKLVKINNIENLISDEDYDYYKTSKDVSPNIEIILLKDLTNKPNVVYDKHGNAYIACAEERKENLEKGLWFKINPKHKNKKVNKLLNDEPVETKKEPKEKEVEVSDPQSVEEFLTPAQKKGKKDGDNKKSN